MFFWVSSTFPVPPRTPPVQLKLANCFSNTHCSTVDHRKPTITMWVNSIVFKTKPNSTWVIKETCFYQTRNKDIFKSYNLSSDNTWKTSAFQRYDVTITTSYLSFTDHFPDDIPNLGFSSMSKLNTVTSCLPAQHHEQLTQLHLTA